MLIRLSNVTIETFFLNCIQGKQLLKMLVANNCTVKPICRDISRDNGIVCGVLYV